MSVATASATATLTADEIIVCSGLGGVAYKLANFSNTINIAASGGPGGMDTGTAPANGYVAIYAIYNPTTGASALLATNATSTKAPEVYSGANMPPGMKASALVSVWPTNSSRQFIIGSQVDRMVGFGNSSALTTSTSQAAITALSISGIVPPNARAIYGNMVTSNTAAANTQMSIYSGAAGGFACNNFSNITAAAGGGQAAPYGRMPLSVQQTTYYNTNNAAGSPTWSLMIGAYEI
ncbi:phage tail protein [Burkholderia diffusa]|nr:phage tail protein [Burkholderia diffusa]